MTAEIKNALQIFLENSRFLSRGGVITDLDGSAVHEDQGRIYIPQPVEYGLKAVYETGRPVVINTMRFPLSVLRTFGREWLSITAVPIPVITLNGSQLGYVSYDIEGHLHYQEIQSFPMEVAEVDLVLDGVQRLVDDHVRDVLLFYYPRDWRMGEIIWTPSPEKVLGIKQKYTSASAVTAVDLGKLRRQLWSEPVCMMFLLIEAEQDRLMAYQHHQGGHFFTRQGVDKLWGCREMCRHLGIDLSQSVGAGDTELDRYLNEVGLSVHVGPLQLPFRGCHTTMRVKSSLELGEVLFQLVSLHREATTG